MDLRKYTHCGGIYRLRASLETLRSEVIRLREINRELRSRNAKITAINNDQRRKILDSKPLKKQL